MPENFNIRLVFVIVPDRGNRHGLSAIPPVRMLHSQHAQRPARSSLQENGILELPQLVQGIVEPGRVIGVHGPISRIGSLASGDPRPGDVGDVRDGRLVQLNLVHLGLKCLHDRIKHSRVKGVGILNVPTNNAPFIQHPLELSHGNDRTCHHTQTWTIDQRDGQIVGKQGKQFIFWQRDCKHGSLRQLIDQLGPRRNQPQRILERQYSSQTCSNVFTHAVTDNGFRRDPQRLPEPGHCIFDCEQRRLGEQCLIQLPGVLIHRCGRFSTEHLF